MGLCFPWSFFWFSCFSFLSSFLNLFLRSYLSFFYSRRQVLCGVVLGSLSLLFPSTVFTSVFACSYFSPSKFCFSFTPSFIYFVSLWVSWTWFILCLILSWVVYRFYSLRGWHVKFFYFLVSLPTELQRFSHLICVYVLDIQKFVESFVIFCICDCRVFLCYL